MGDCIIYSNFSYLLLKEYNKKYGNEFKYLSIKKDVWGEEENDFHQFITFKYRDIWYFLDRFECSIYIKKKKDKKIKLTEWNTIDLTFQIKKCGFKSEMDAQINIFKIVNKHLLLLTKKKYSYSF